VKLAGDEVVVVVVPIRAERELALDLELLSHDEQERAARFTSESPRREFVVMRAALRRLLGDATGRSPDAVVLEYGAEGKPRLDGSDLRFSVSHADGLGLIALTTGRDVGVDIERLEPRDARGTQALAVWTAKEACLKATGQGISVRPDTIEIALPESDGVPVPAGSSRLPADLHLARLDVGDGYVAAVAARGGGWLVRTVGGRHIGDRRY
jgi:4'-phosphopantetheinyl transferase